MDVVAATNAIAVAAVATNANADAIKKILNKKHGKESTKDKNAKQEYKIR